MTAAPLTAIFVESSNKAALALIAQLHRRAFSAQDEQPWSLGAIEKLMASPGFEALVYFAADVPVGFVLVRVVADEAELISVAVDPDCQSKGYAKQVMSFLCDQLKKRQICNLFLEVRQDNQKAIQLYRSCGFKKIGERRDYYKTTSGKKLDAHVFSFTIE